MFFDTWSGLLRVAIVGVLAYVGLVVLQRLTGKRTLSKMNAFDLVVTVALGSGLATIILSKDVALAEGLLAFLLLMSLQYAVTWLSVRSDAVSHMVKSEPKLLAYDGRMLKGVMFRERVVEAEILQALRSSGVLSLAEVQAVVLETDGSFSVLEKSDISDKSALSDVHGPRPEGGSNGH